MICPAVAPQWMKLMNKFLLSCVLCFRFGWHWQCNQVVDPLPSLLLFFSFSFLLDTSRHHLNSWSHDCGHGRGAVRLCAFYRSRARIGSRSAGRSVKIRTHVFCLYTLHYMYFAHSRYKQCKHWQHSQLKFIHVYLFFSWYLTLKWEDHY